MAQRPLEVPQRRDVAAAAAVAELVMALELVALAGVVAASAAANPQIHEQDRSRSLEGLFTDPFTPTDAVRVLPHHTFRAESALRRNEGRDACLGNGATLGM